jgi:2-iminobutanoate/2-iminopropanoate deaminase
MNRNFLEAPKHYMKKAISIPGAPSPIGPYSQAIKTSNMLFISGQVPLDPISGNIQNDSIESSTHQVMKNIKALLEEAGMDFGHVVKCSIFLTDLNHFSSVNSVYAGYFSDVPPARETVQVSRLPLDVDIEISCIAIKE